MERSEQNITVRGASSKGIPKNRAHSEMGKHPVLFLADHAKHTAAFHAPALNFPGHEENELAEGVVLFNALARRAKVLAKILVSHAMENGRRGCSLGGAVRSSDAVLVQAAGSRVSDEHNPVSVWFCGCADVDPRRTMSMPIGPSPSRGEDFLDLGRV